MASRPGGLGQRLWECSQKDLLQSGRPAWGFGSLSMPGRSRVVVGKACFPGGDPPPGSSEVLDETG